VGFLEATRNDELFDDLALSIRDDTCLEELRDAAEQP
jgi:hypothetical protein